MKPPLSGLNFNLLKLIAMVSMTLDHVDLILFDRGLGWPTLFGRLAFPLFAFLTAYHLLFHTRVPKRYLQRLAVFALISQGVTMVIIDSEKLNIFVTLLLGILPLYAWMTTLKRQYFFALLGGAVLFTLMGSDVLPVDYGMVGVVLTASIGYALKTGARIGYVTALAALCLLNAGWIEVMATLMVIPLVAVSSKTRLSPGGMRHWPWLWYWYYPAHIFLLGVIRLAIR